MNVPLHRIHALPKRIQNLLQVAHGVWSEVLPQDAVQVLVLSHEHHQGVFREAPAKGWECNSSFCWQIVFSNYMLKFQPYFDENEKWLSLPGILASVLGELGDGGNELLRDARVGRAAAEGLRDAHPVRGVGE